MPKRLIFVSSTGKTFENSNETSENSSETSSNSALQINPAVCLYPQYKVSGPLSSGGFGTVFLAVDNDHRKYAIKVQKYKPPEPMLQHELTICKRLLFDSQTGLASCGFPRVFNYILRYDHEFLVMERLGDSLRKKMESRPSQKLSKKSTLMIGIQVVRRLQMLHQSHILHRDIKPENLLMGLGSEEHTVHIIDFGVSTIVEDWATYDPNARLPFRGTYAFAAAEALLEKQPTRGGDIQSLVYTLLEMVSGYLPWQYEDVEYGRELTMTELAIQRLTKKPAELCVDFPELIQFVKLSMRIHNNAEPNYGMLVKELETALKRIGCQNDGLFDWIVEQKSEAGTQTPKFVEESYHERIFDVPSVLPVSPAAYDSLGGIFTALDEMPGNGEMHDLYLQSSIFGSRDQLINDPNDEVAVEILEDLNFTEPDYICVEPPRKKKKDTLNKNHNMKFGEVEPNISFCGCSLLLNGCRRLFQAGLKLALELFHRKPSVKN